MAFDQLFDENQGAAPQHTVADTVAAELHIGILRGEFPGGSQLKIQELADRFGVSTMPIREALRNLTALGLVQILPHRGARVLELSLEDMHDTMSVRLALEPLATERAAANLSGEDATLAMASLARMEAHIASNDRITARSDHRDFHLTLYRAAGSPWLLRLIEPLWQNADRYRFAYPLTDADQIESNHEHRLILAACIAGDAEAASQEMRSHLERTRTRVETVLIQAQQGASSPAGRSGKRPPESCGAPQSP